MIRMVLMVVGVVLAAWLLLTCWRQLARRELDWKGLTFAGAFVALAFYLHHATGIG